MKSEQPAVALLLLFLLLGTLQAQPMPPYFIDDFEDGSAHDGEPVNWLAMDPGTGEGRRVVSGSYVLTPVPDKVMADYADGRVFDDVSVRTQFAYLDVPDTFSAIGVFARGDRANVGGNFEWTGYCAGITNTGFLQIGKTISGDIQVLRETEFSPVLITSDVNIEFDLFGDNLSATAWQDGSAQPTDPQLSISDTSVSQGEAGIWLQGSANRVPGAFRWVAAIPEPASSALAMTLLLGLLILLRR